MLEVNTDPLDVDAFPPNERSDLVVWDAHLKSLSLHSGHVLGWSRCII